jgi:HAE1 family hydrophobic/amphiphilic exporter-1
MITATVLAVFFVPVFYVAIQWLIEQRNGPPRLRPGQVAHAPLEPVVPHAKTSAPATEVNGADGSPAEVTKSAKK